MSCLPKVLGYVKREWAMRYSVLTINVRFSIYGDGVIHNFSNILSFLMKD